MAGSVADGAAAASSVKQEQPAVEKVKQILYRRLKVILQSGRVIEGDFACLDPQGNLILSNASEHIKAAHSSSSNSSDTNNSSSSNSSSSPPLNPMGMVLVPKDQQKEVLLQVTLSEKAAMLSLVGS